MTARTLRIFLAAFGAVFLCLSPAMAQSPVITRPHSVTNSNASSTITTGVGGAFQSVISAATSSFGNIILRGGCVVQNNSVANPMYVFFGPIASATVGTSVKLKPGDSASCNVGGSVLKDQVSVSGTSGDAFYAGQQ